MKSSLLAKTKAVLEAVCQAERPVAIKELTSVLDMPLPTISRLCADLVEIGLLEKADYHHLIPGISFIRFGCRAREVSPLIEALKQPVSDYLNVSGLSAAVFGFDREYPFEIYLDRRETLTQDILRHTGAFMVLLNAAGVSPEKAQRLILRRYPDMSATERVICDREFHVIRRQGYLTRVLPNRRWMITMPFTYGTAVCALAVYGTGREGSSIEAEMFEVSKVVSRIRTRVDRIGKGRD